MLMAKAMAFAAVLAVHLAAAAAVVDHPVGGDGSWDASGTNYNGWASTQKIVQGDTISFKYTSSHDVVEVTKAGYDACSGANPIKSYTGGATTVKLTNPGKHYFICSIPGHCAAGMKLQVTVAAAAGTGAPAPTTKSSKPRHQRSVAPTPAPAEAPAVPSPTPMAAPPGSSDAARVGMLGAKAVMGLAAGVALALALAM